MNIKIWYGSLAILSIVVMTFCFSAGKPALGYMSMGFVIFDVVMLLIRKEEK